MRLMDCLANFGQLPPDFTLVGKAVNLGGIFDTFGGPMGAPGDMARGLCLLGCG